MSWYNKILPQKEMIKTASGNSDDAIANNQEGNYDVLFDVQRYVMDSYLVKTAISTTSYKIGVTLLCNHAFLGTVAWDAYWSYDLKDGKKAKKLYNTINKVIKELIETFVEEEIPTPLFWTMLRSKVEMLDKDNQAAINIPCLNYARHIPIAPDWRSNIYGTRYPVYSEPNYSQEVKFWARQSD